MAWRDTVGKIIELRQHTYFSKSAVCLIYLSIIESWNCLDWKGSLKSSPAINPALPSSSLNQVLSVTFTHFLNTIRDSGSTTSLGSPFQFLTILLGRIFFFLMSSLNHPYAIWAHFPCPIIGYFWEKTDILLISSYFQVAWIFRASSCFKR